MICAGIYYVNWLAQGTSKDRPNDKEKAKHVLVNNETTQNPLKTKP